MRHSSGLALTAFSASSHECGGCCAVLPPFMLLVWAQWGGCVSCPRSSAHTDAPPMWMLHPHTHSQVPHSPMPRPRLCSTHMHIHVHVYAPPTYAPRRVLFPERLLRAAVTLGLGGREGAAGGFPHLARACPCQWRVLTLGSASRPALEGPSRTSTQAVPWPRGPGWRTPPADMFRGSPPRSDPGPSQDGVWGEAAATAPLAL